MGTGEYFRRKLDFEKTMKDKLEKFIEQQLSPSAIKDISGERDGIERDKDYALLINGRWVRAECKIRSTKYRKHALEDILIETKSSVEDDTPGWIYRSAAELLIYVWEFPTGVFGIILRLPELKKWWMENRHYYTRRILAPNPPNNPEYHTENYVVPISDLPDDLFYVPIR